MATIKIMTMMMRGGGGGRQQQWLQHQFSYLHLLQLNIFPLVHSYRSYKTTTRMMNNVHYSISSVLCLKSQGSIILGVILIALIGHPTHDPGTPVAFAQSCSTLISK